LFPAAAYFGDAWLARDDAILTPNAALAEKRRAKTALAEKHPSPVTGMVV
jgi:hypothetical protein